MMLSLLREEEGFEGGYGVALLGCERERLLLLLLSLFFVILPFLTDRGLVDHLLMMRDGHLVQSCSVLGLFLFSYTMSHKERYRIQLFGSILTHGLS